MDPLDLARWQFGIVTVYHFLFVPITIGLSAIVAGYETAWVRTRNPHWLRLTKFFGKLFLINFAIGVNTEDSAGALVSGGERARIAVARSLLADQPVLVLDEPTAHLDHATAEELAAEPLGADADARSVLWITHAGVGLDLVDRVLDISECGGSPSALIGRQRTGDPWG